MLLTRITGVRISLGVPDKDIVMTTYFNHVPTATKLEILKAIIFGKNIRYVYEGYKIWYAWYKDNVYMVHFKKV